VGALKAATDKAEQTFTGESRRLHYLSVPPNAALSAARTLGEAGLVERSRVVMEKPFGIDLASAVALTPGSWGPNVIHSLIAPHAWRLPFERPWRDPNSTGT